MSYPGYPVLWIDRQTASSERESFPCGCGGRTEHPAYDRSHGVCGASVVRLIIQWTGPVPVPPRLQTRDVTTLHHHKMKSDSQRLEVGHIGHEDLTASSAHIRTAYREGPGEVVEIMLYGGVVRENGLQLVVCRRAGKCLETMSVVWNNPFTCTPRPGDVSSGCSQPLLS